MPLRLFRDRNFSLANLGISTMGFAITAMAFPIMLYAQLVRGLSPTQSALLLVPMAVMSIVLAPSVGRLTDRIHPRSITAVGFTAIVVSLTWLSRVMTPDSATWEILLPMVLLGIGNACVWAPLSATATRNLPPQLAGAGAGVYNATRQVGAVLGSAAIAVLMDSRIAAHGLAFQPTEATSGAGHAGAGARRVQRGDGRRDAAAGPRAADRARRGAVLRAVPGPAGDRVTAADSAGRLRVPPPDQAVLPVRRGGSSRPR